MKMKMGISKDTLSILLKTILEKSTSLKTIQKNIILTAIEPRYRNPNWSLNCVVNEASISKDTTSTNETVA